ncbi:predicted protein [Postia placenta Mad-698-R]|nr:predicted protein [Postia placenta Mad-698-R]
MANQLQHGQANSVVPPGMEREDRMLAIYIRDLCLKRNWVNTARALSEDANLDQANEAPISTARGFLWEWWIVFWKTHSAATEPRGTDNPQTGAQNQPGMQPQATQTTSASIHGTHSQASAPMCNSTASTERDPSRIPENTGIDILRRRSATISSRPQTYMSTSSAIGALQHEPILRNPRKRSTVPPVQHPTKRMRIDPSPWNAAYTPPGLAYGSQPMIAQGLQPLSQQPAAYDPPAQLPPNQDEINPGFFTSGPFESFGINPEFNSE